ncbi:uncharacterized protein si:zfos-741a10.3 [Gadus macrocephalus]|uniref:uncharacterized protein si:zfos-741a10.3 n=1 Tax=Gadus macrocephalus TaxID=80720 RepID=UPI0028CB4DD1|nr:uncharacterized protein si:zfos-741a10.3 [Gadus macrocephalus]
MLNMGAVLLLLIGVADGVETFCNATQPHIITQCFGSLGGTVEVLLSTKTKQDYIYKLKKNNVTVNRSETTDSRYSFIVSTGIFTIKDVNMKDTGEYSMEVHDADGKQVAYTECYLTIQVTALVPIIAGSLSAMALLLIVALGVYCAKKHKTSRDTTEAEDVTYADVSVLQRRGQRREEGEGEVEYGAVREAPGPRRTLETNVDECVYAQPQSTRP